jgi:pyruvate/2-oxoglutarate dehydrogenase complex dihydrolipoamide dehydrogenase (E3) component
MGRIDFAEWILQNKLCVINSDHIFAAGDLDNNKLLEKIILEYGALINDNIILNLISKDD